LAPAVSGLPAVHLCVTYDKPTINPRALSAQVSHIIADEDYPVYANFVQYGLKLVEWLRGDGESKQQGEVTAKGENRCDL
jgi:hypothetical protein